MTEDLYQLIQSADNGDVAAQEKVGTAYFKGNGVDKDIVRALHYFSMAAKNGSGLGYYQLGRAYETGTGAQMDIKKALEYYEKSAELGYQNAENKLKVLKEQMTQSPEAPAGASYNPPMPQQAAYVPPQPAGTNPINQAVQQPAVKPKSKITAALFAFFLGFLGIHNFYLGYKKKAIIQLIMTLTLVLAPISSLWAFVEFILILLGGIPSDARGIRLS